jgi:hypothetical protein
MVRVIDQDGSFVQEDALGLFKGDAVLPFVHDCLRVVPLEPQLGHDHIVTTL